MKTKSRNLCLLATFPLCVIVGNARAEITSTGNVEPEIANWDATITGYVGRNSDGTIDIAGGSNLFSRDAYLGEQPGVTGSATITGEDSTWINGRTLYVGHSGAGIVNVESGGRVTTNGLELGSNANSTGSLNIMGTGSHLQVSDNLVIGVEGDGWVTVQNGGELVAREIFGAADSMHGNGTITATEGAVLDATLQFSAVNGTQSTSVFGNGGSLLVNANGGNLGAGYKSNGSLEISGGFEVTSNRGYLGYKLGSQGVATLTGTGTHWNLSRELYVGLAGNGVLTLDAGAQVSSNTSYVGHNDGSVGTVTVSGQDSYWFARTLHIGENGNGNLLIENGGAVTGYSRYFGKNVGSYGTARITGAGSELGSSSPFYVGDLGNGELTVEAGGTVRNSYGYMGHAPGSSGTATISGQDSRWSNSRTLNIGHEGYGSVDIDAGAYLSARNTNLGFAAGASGEVSVMGVETTFRTLETLTVGDSGNGSLSISAGAYVSGGSEFYIARLPGSSGIVDMSGEGSTLYAAHVTIGSSVFNGNSGRGTLSLSSGAFLGTHRGGSIRDGRVVVSGNGTQWTASNNAISLDNLTSELIISDGGTIESRGAFIRDGNVFIEGEGSHWDSLGSQDSGHLIIGRDASSNAKLSIQDGGSFVVDAVSVYGQEGIVVDGDGSTLTATGSFYLGIESNSSLLVSSGAALAGNYMVLGHREDANATARISGPGSHLTADQLFVGVTGGHGTLIIEDGAEVNVGFIEASLSDLSGNGTINANGAILDADIRFDAGGASSTTVEFGDGGLINISSNGSTLGVNRGKLVITNGSNVVSARGHFGSLNSLQNYDSFGFVSGAGSTWQVERLQLSSGGSLQIEEQATLTSTGSSIGTSGINDLGDSRVVVTGIGTKWIDESYIEVGSRFGEANLQVSHGAEIVTNVMYTSLDNLSGNGRIIATNGAALDGFFRFDQLNTMQQDFVFGDGGVLSIDWNGGYLGVGWNDYALATISDGVSVTTAGGEIGRGHNSVGTVIVSGSHSEWINTGSLSVGTIGIGTLLIQDHAYVQAANVTTGLNSDARGNIVVSGSDSQLKAESAVRLYNDRGEIHLRNGGSVIARTLDIGAGSLLTVDVGRGSFFSLSGVNSTVTNRGIIRALAGPELTTSGYTIPVGSRSWSGGGSYQAIGGTVSRPVTNGFYQFTVSENVTGELDETISLDLSEYQRVLFLNNGEELLGISLLSKVGSPAPVDVNVTALEQTTLDILDAQVIAAWEVNVTGSGYEADDPLYLSFSIDEILESDELKIWQYEDQSWMPFTDPGFSVASGFASFTVSEPGLYAIAEAYTADFNEDFSVDGGDLALWQAEYGDAATLADANDDGWADGSDLLAWQRQHTGTETLELASWQDGYGTVTQSADFDENGVADGADYLTWQQQFVAANGLTSNSAVPEPSALALLLLSLVGFVCHRK